MAVRTFPSAITRVKYFEDSNVVFEKKGFDVFRKKMQERKPRSYCNDEINATLSHCCADRWQCLASSYVGSTRARKKKFLVVVETLHT